MPVRRFDALILKVLATALLAGSTLVCGPADQGREPAPEPAAPAAAEEPAAPVVEVTTKDYGFYGPSEIPSGWTTFRMTNEGEETHFLVLWLLPEDRSFDEYADQVAQPFAELLLRYRGGEMEKEEFLETLGGRLPEWFQPAALGRGGPGFLASGRTVETTVRLEPGTYVMECYMMSPEGKIHGKEGMLRPLTVSAEDSGGSPPEAGVEVTLSNYEIDARGELAPGENTVRVTVAEQPEGLLGHDLHLVRLDEDTDLEAVVRWMDWVDALQSPAPAEFVGGAEQVPAGHTTYFTVDLEPGRYAWISEGYAHQGMVREVRVE